MGVVVGHMAQGSRRVGGCARVGLVILMCRQPGSGQAGDASTMLDTITNARCMHRQAELRTDRTLPPARPMPPRLTTCAAAAQVLPSATANTHLTTALTHIAVGLDTVSLQRFKTLRQRGDLAARRAMRDMLILQAGGPRGVSVVDPGTGRHWCGHNPLTAQERETQQGEAARGDGESKGQRTGGPAGAEAGCKEHGRRRCGRP